MAAAGPTPVAWARTWSARSSPPSSSSTSSASATTSAPPAAVRLPRAEPGDRWCVTVANWLRAYEDGVASFVVLASTSAGALDTVPLAALEEHAVDVPADPRELAD